MTDRVTSDGVETYRARLVRTGGGVGVAVPAAAALTPGDEIRLDIAGATRYARVGRHGDGAVIRGAYDARSDLRTLTGDDTAVSASDVTDRLGEWIRGIDRGVGDSVALDCVEAGHQYGLRVPGDRVVYTIAGRPDDSLQDIASRLDE